MSQKKMEAYKYAKKNKKEIEKKAKRKRILAWTCGILATVVIVGASAYLVYYTSVIVPKKQSAEAASDAADNEETADDVLNILNQGLSEDGNSDFQITTEPMEVTPDTDDSNAEDSTAAEEDATADDSTAAEEDATADDSADAEEDATAE